MAMSDNDIWLDQSTTARGGCIELQGNEMLRGDRINAIFTWNHSASSANLTQREPAYSQRRVQDSCTEFKILCEQRAYEGTTRHIAEGSKTIHAATVLHTLSCPSSIRHTFTVGVSCRYPSLVALPSNGTIHGEDE
ncbi:hypothetical protein DFH06DRAFT_1140865 [Mycena polygramma]|nr:hypothetical protein DFH06DRAFT_1140865 [Mycena polygramma]